MLGRIAASCNSKCPGREFGARTLESWSEEDGRKKKKKNNNNTKTLVVLTRAKLPARWTAIARHAGRRRSCKRVLKSLASRISRMMNALACGARSQMIAIRLPSLHWLGRYKCLDSSQFQLLPCGFVAKTKWTGKENGPSLELTGGVQFERPKNNKFIWFGGRATSPRR